MKRLWIFFLLGFVPCFRAASVQDIETLEGSQRNRLQAIISALPTGSSVSGSSNAPVSVATSPVVVTPDGTGTTNIFSFDGTASFNASGATTLNANNLASGNVPFPREAVGVSTNLAVTPPWLSWSFASGVYTLNTNSTKIPLGNTDQNGALLTGIPFSALNFPFVTNNAATPNWLIFTFASAVATLNTNSTKMPMGNTDYALVTTNVAAGTTVWMTPALSGNTWTLNTNSTKIPSGNLGGDVANTNATTLFRTILVNPGYQTQILAYATAARVDPDLNKGNVMFLALTNAVVLNLPSNLVPGAPFTISITPAGFTPIWTNGYVCVGGKLPWDTTAGHTNFVSGLYDGNQVNIACSTNMSRPL